jgi:hypothetical protein
MASHPEDRDLSSNHHENLKSQKDIGGIRVVIFMLQASSRYRTHYLLQRFVSPPCAWIRLVWHDRLVRSGFQNRAYRHVVGLTGRDRHVARPSLTHGKTQKKTDIHARPDWNWNLDPSVRALEPNIRLRPKDRCDGRQYSRRAARGHTPRYRHTSLLGNT